MKLNTFLICNLQTYEFWVARVVACAHSRAQSALVATQIPWKKVDWQFDCWFLYTVDLKWNCCCAAKPVCNCKRFLKAYRYHRIFWNWLWFDCFWADFYLTGLHCVSCLYLPLDALIRVVAIWSDYRSWPYSVGWVKIWRRPIVVHLNVKS